ncbi:DnaJ domain-containing protein [Marivirga sp. S37H4]|uniref:DnaJ domain-containing protein n=1 Tax=Marivirga aurantiaca TaxID=2802615 RepID=A0A935CAD1_9BACT|nr:DnaJ domain-containing protein [Marivirga aurantiaca]MBK6266696.1 DnaJ domain-containing protein [Marivirga aurantiaca]
MSNSEHIYYQSLRELGLAEGATPDEIKQAFRSLSKKYHPDVYPDDQGEQFKAINNAYLYLKKHPEPPQTVYESQTVYQENYKEEYRKKYWARKKKESEMKRQMFHWIFSRVRIILLVVSFLNIILAVDYLLPNQEIEKQLISARGFTKSYNARGGKIHEYYTLLNFNDGYEMRIKHADSEIFEEGEIFKISASPITAQPIKVESLKNPGQMFYQRYGVFAVFGFIIPLVLICSWLYFYLIKNNDYRLSLVILILILGMAQLVLLFA